MEVEVEVEVEVEEVKVIALYKRGRSVGAPCVFDVLLVHIAGDICCSKILHDRQTYTYILHKGDLQTETQRRGRGGQ